MEMTVQMGRLPAGSGEEQALEWLVLERRADRMLLVSFCYYLKQKTGQNYLQS